MVIKTHLFSKNISLSLWKLPYTDEASVKKAKYF